MDVADRAMQLATGTQLGVYEIRRPIGQGGFGVTYLGMDTSLEMPVAIKEYLPEHIAARAGDMTVNPLAPKFQDTFHWGLSRFAREARTLAKFKHPNIVRVMSVFEANNTAYMVMEYEQGQDLKTLFDYPQWRSEAALRGVLKPIVDGLAEVHRLGYIHRDIKPANIMVRDNGTPVLLDFGSARMATGANTQSLTALVSVGYAPLEQYNEADDTRQGPWTDIYALGAVLYYAVTGSAPVDSTLRGSALLNDSADPLAPLAYLDTPHYSPAFCEAIDWALSFKVADRPQSLAEWSEKLLPDPVTSHALPLPPTPSSEPTITRPRTLETSIGVVPLQLSALAREHNGIPGQEAANSATSIPRTSQSTQSPVNAPPVSPAVADSKSRRSDALLLALGLLVFVAILATWYWRTGPASAELATQSNDTSSSSSAGDGADADPSETTLLEPDSGQETADAGAVKEPQTLPSDAALARLELQQLEERSRRERLAELERRLEAAEEENRRLEALREERLEASRLAAQELERLEMQAEVARRAAVVRKPVIATDSVAAAESAVSDVSVKATAPSSQLVTTSSGTTAAPEIDPSLSITNADMAEVFSKFSDLEQAIIEKDMQALKALTVESPRNNAYFNYLFGNYESIEASIDSSMRTSRRDQSIRSTLTIERMLRANGDIALPPSAFARIPLKSIRQGNWSKIHW